MVIEKFLHKFFSVTLALLVLFSTVSFTIEKHFCGDVLVDVSMFVEAEKCAMEALELLQQKTCCKDEIDVVQGQDELKVSFDNFSSDQQLIVASFIYTYLNLFEGLEENVIPLQDCTPPILVRHIFKLDESYLI